MRHFGKYRCDKDDEITNDDDNDRFRPQILEVVNNRIYFYADIEKENVLKLNKTLMELDADHVSTMVLNSDKELRSIFLYVNSYGGSVFDGLSAMDQLNLTKSPITTVVDGVSASAATFLTLQGKTRLIKQNAFMLIHQISSSCWGKYDDFKDEMDNLDKLMEIVRKIYLEKTNLTKTKLDGILKHDLYFNAKECVKFGMVDDILK